MLHVHHSDDEAWPLLEGELTFRCSDRTESVSAWKNSTSYRQTSLTPTTGERCPLSHRPYATVERTDFGAARLIVSRLTSTRSTGVSTRSCWSNQPSRGRGLPEQADQIPAFAWVEHSRGLHHFPCVLRERRFDQPPAPWGESCDAGARISGIGGGLEKPSALQPVDGRSYETARRART